MGLILVPLVEKAAEHLTAVDEAWDNQMNFALAHILGATVQTALFNSSLVVIVGWGLDKAMDLNFEVFNIVILIMSIIVVGNFLRDQKSNYLEGSLCIFIYILIGMLPDIYTFDRAITFGIAIASWYYPNPAAGTSNTAEGAGREAGVDTVVLARFSWLFTVRTCQSVRSSIAFLAWRWLFPPASCIISRNLSKN